MLKLLSERSRCWIFNVFVLAYLRSLLNQRRQHEINTVLKPYTLHCCCRQKAEPL
jgi:hypothetical protein